ncbi:hypothetical protein MTO96_019887 [Rhipicephalus appendiculatus]
MAPAAVSPAQASTFRWEVSQPETWRNHLTHPAEWFRDVLGIIGWRAPLGSLASLDSSSRWQGAVVVRPSPRGLPSRAPGFDPFGRPPPLARTHRSRRRARARGQWRPPDVTADVVALGMAFLCTALLGGKRNAFFGGPQPALRSFRRRAHDFLPRKEKESGTVLFLCFKVAPRFMPALTPAAHALREERRFERGRRDYSFEIDPLFP